MSEKEENIQKRPPQQPIESLQYNLFSNFLSNNDKDVSNSVEYWERIPKYFLTVAQQKNLRTEDGLAPPYTYEYRIKDKNGNYIPYKIKIQPALIEQEDGNYKACFPTKTEENVEEVLKKIFTDQSLGIHDTNLSESWVRFSYGMIRRELKRMNCGLKYPQIKHSLEVMSKCVLTVYEKEREVYTGSILQDYCSVDREKYLDDTKQMHVARFPIFISHAINTLQYRQFNFLGYMECKEQLARWIYKRLINRFTNANYFNDYHFLYSDIKQSSGLLLQKDEKNNRRKLILALTELKDKNIIYSFETEESIEKRKIIEIKYTLKPHSKFVSEQKASNKRLANGTNKMVYLSVNK